MYIAYDLDVCVCVCVGMQPSCMRVEWYHVREIAQHQMLEASLTVHTKQECMSSIARIQKKVSFLTILVLAPEISQQQNSKKRPNSLQGSKGPSPSLAVVERFHYNLKDLTFCCSGVSW